MTSEFNPIVVTAISSLASALIGSASVAWKMRGFVADTAEKLDIKVAATEKILNEKIDRVQSSCTEEHGELLSKNGEALSAIRQKITDTELWNRDTFVRRSDFTTVIDGFNRAIENLTTKFENGIKDLRAEMNAGHKHIEEALTDKLRRQ